MQSTDNASQVLTDHYAVLGLNKSGTAKPGDVSEEDLKTAYHQTLLRYHPDKAQKTAHREASATYSVDQILDAYRTLSSPSTKSSYDQNLRQRSKQNWLDKDQGRNTGFEVFDLDELHYHESDDSWTKSCRCGAIPAYRIVEKQLTAGTEEGEIVVQCNGCSLFIKVLFQTI
ncbi:hypothetical protein BT93_L4784 [Corymbia citriodora subsp. variegata]|uniref:Diphthamide biosynthesis protein 4 n=1 Tax=Corymbia citriodora subsp. variegata TaxID=360336 RepID=A0A8T0CFG7_CORYI|nr:hypothetical protein BT93_L4784 [Corymbia citriodora subsp. variegata]